MRWEAGTATDHIRHANLVIRIRAERWIADRGVRIKDVEVLKQSQIRGIDSRNLHKRLWALVGAAIDRPRARCCPGFRRLIRWK